VDDAELLRYERTTHARIAAREGSTVRLYFHVTNGSEIIRDEQGIEVPSLDHARREALRTIAEVRAEDPASRDWSGWTFRITDPGGRVVLLLDLDGDPL
jgi:hypothetical protein